MNNRYNSGNNKNNNNKNNKGSQNNRSRIPNPRGSGKKVGTPPSPRQQNVNYGYATQKRYTVPYQYTPRPRKSKFPVYTLRFTLFLIITAIILGVASLLFYINLTHTTKQGNVNFEFYFSEALLDKEKKESKDTPIKKYAPYDTVVKDNALFIPFTDISDRLNFVLSGDKAEYSFTVAKTNEYMRINLEENRVVINDVEYHTPLNAFEYNESLYLPADFVQNNINGIMIEQEKDTVKIYVDGSPEDGDFPVPSVRFRILNPEKTPNIDELATFNEIYTPEVFLTDLSAYEQYFSPENINEYLSLINYENPIDPIDYYPPDLAPVNGNTERQLRLYPAKALEAFLQEAAAHGHTGIYLNSAYRNYDLQTSLYNNEVAAFKEQYGENYLDFVVPTTAKPGHSEHQSGLCADISTAGIIAESFGDTPTGKWLAENARYFGFVVRYPKDKVDITQIGYEPWHFRYVGRTHAMRMYDLNMCLEEYIVYLKKYNLLK